HFDHVRVIERARHLCLATKPRDLASVFGCGAAQHFDGDLGAESDVLGGVDDADAAGADALADAVLPAEDGAHEIAGGRGGDVAAELEAALQRGDARALEGAIAFELLLPREEDADAVAERTGDDGGENAGDPVDEPDEDETTSGGGEGDERRAALELDLF